MTAFFQSSDITAAWSRASARAIDDNRPATRSYVEALAKEYANGTVVHADFELELAEPMLEMAAHVENWAFSQMLDLVWMLPAVAKRIPKLGKTKPDVHEHFESADVFELAASLGRILHHGGAYSSWSKPTAPCHALGLACAEELMEPPPSLAFISTMPWCDFFLDVAWDYSVVVVAPARKRVSVLLATDTD